MKERKKKSWTPLTCKTYLPRTEELQANRSNEMALYTENLVLSLPGGLRASHHSLRNLDTTAKEMELVDKMRENCSSSEMQLLTTATWIPAFG